MATSVAGWSSLAAAFDDLILHAQPLPAAVVGTEHAAADLAMNIAGVAWFAAAAATQ